MIFLDSCYIINLLNENSEDHKNAKKILEVLPQLNYERKCINNIVFIEVLNKLKKSYFRGKEEEIINFLLHIDEIYYVDEDDYEKALKLCQFYKFTVNYSDCLIALTMQKHGIENILTFDKDFNRIDGINAIYIS